MTYTEIQADVDFLADTDSVTYPVADKTRNANLALNEASAIIIGCDGTWQWDDTNYTTLPIGVTDLVSGQQQYRYDATQLYVEGMENKDASGNWKKLIPIDLYTEQTTSITDFMKSTGTPTHYDLVGDIVFLYPSPNYSQSSSLKVFYQRKAQAFTISDTTKEAGFAPHLHRFISISVAYDWAVAKQHPKQVSLLNEKNRYIEMIKKVYSKRDKTERPKLQIINQNNK
ncbi:hypothetical protein KBD45_08290 [Candidatus Dojkabacteria bacterium]|nr:hypothetical protein [Candidatus Dojkabacteria bacterium]